MNLIRKRLGMNKLSRCRYITASDNYTDEPTRDSKYIMGEDVVISEYNRKTNFFNAPFTLDGKWPEEDSECIDILDKLGLIDDFGNVWIKAGTPIVQCFPFGGGGGCCAITFKVGDHVINVDLIMDIVQVGEDTYKLC